MAALRLLAVSLSSLIVRTAGLARIGRIIGFAASQKDVVDLGVMT